MNILYSPCAPPPASGDTLQYRNRKERFERRNKKILGMDQKVQDGYKRLIDRTNGQRYVP